MEGEEKETGGDVEREREKKKEGTNIRTVDDLRGGRREITVGRYTIEAGEVGTFPVFEDS